MASKHFRYASPSADPLEAYEAFRATLGLGDDEDEPDEVQCDFCNGFADMTTPQGWFCCQACAETEYAIERE